MPHGAWSSRVLSNAPGLRSLAQIASVMQIPQKQSSWKPCLLFKNSIWTAVFGIKLGCRNIANTSYLDRSKALNEFYRREPEFNTHPHLCDAQLHKSTVWCTLPSQEPRRHICEQIEHEFHVCSTSAFQNKSLLVIFLGSQHASKPIACHTFLLLDNTSVTVQ